jgi:PTH1 family peptidyl-tRNA hydrolase
MEHRPIQLVVGLGNPGAEHELDRHNAGFWFVDLLAESYATRFKEERKFNGDMCRIRIGSNELRLLKPMTYMNRSGHSIQAVCSYFKIAPAQVMVVHDELDLAPGVARLKRGGGHGGHNGLRSVVAQIGRDFFRLRLGIGHPGNRDMVINYVLSRPGADEEASIREAVTDAVEVMPILLGHGDERAMTRLHSRDGNAAAAATPDRERGQEA